MKKDHNHKAQESPKIEFANNSDFSLIIRFFLLVFKSPTIYIDEKGQVRPSVLLEESAVVKSRLVVFHVRDVEPVKGVVSRQSTPNIYFNLPQKTTLQKISMIIVCMPLYNYIQIRYLNCL